MQVLLAVGVWRWLRRLGGAGLILLGLADNSLVPLPGSVDALTIILAAHKKESWWIYAICATVGSVIGGYLTFRLGRGGEEVLKKRIPKRKVKKFQGLFQKWGFGSVMVPAMLPPPVPIVPFLLTAGAMDYPTRKFFLALTTGRGIRYFVVAYLGQVYGRHILRFFARYYRPLLIALVALAVAGGITLLALYLRKKKKDKKRSPAVRVA